MPSAFNDSFADPDNAIFCLNMDGTMLAISFSDGGLYVMDTEHPEDDLIVYESSDYTEFAGGFHGDKFAFSAGKSGHSIFGLINVDEGAYIGDMESNLQMKAKADESGIWVSEGNLLSEFDPDTLDDKEVAFTDTWNISHFSVSDKHVLAVTDFPSSIRERTPWYMKRVMRNIALRNSGQSTRRWQTGVSRISAS